ncbi:hypothetical protein ACSSS7_007955 [Eimeria intestinalis]
MAQQSSRLSAAVTTGRPARAGPREPRRLDVKHLSQIRHVASREVLSDAASLASPGLLGRGRGRAVLRLFAPPIARAFCGSVGRQCRLARCAAAFAAAWCWWRRVVVVGNPRSSSLSVVPWCALLAWARVSGAAALLALRLWAPVPARAVFALALGPVYRHSRALGAGTVLVGVDFCSRVSRRGYGGVGGAALLLTEPGGVGLVCWASASRLALLLVFPRLRLLDRS